MRTSGPVRAVAKALAFIAWAAAGVALASRAGGAQEMDAMVAGPAMPAAPATPAVVAGDAGVREGEPGSSNQPADVSGGSEGGPAAPGVIEDQRESMRLGPAGVRDSAGAPPLVPAASELGPMLTTLAGVVALVVIVLGGVGLARRGGRSLGHNRAPSGILEVLGRYPMPGGATLILLRAGARVLLLSQARASRLGGARLETLAEFGDADEVASLLALARDARDESISARFGTMLSAFAAEHHDGSRRVPAADDGLEGDLVEVEVIGRAGDAAGRGEDAHAFRGHASSLLRRRLEGLRAWEGATA